MLKFLTSIFPHYGISSTLSSRFIDPHPDEAATYIRQLLLDSFWEVRTAPHTFQDDKKVKLHKALDSIDGAMLRPRNDECDACDIAFAVTLLARFGIIDKGFMVNEQPSVDLCHVFDRWVDIPDSQLITELLPREREAARRCLPRAAERIKWLNSIKGAAPLPPTRDKKPKQRVSRDFLEAMKKAVIAMTSEGATDFSARTIYSRMQEINPGLAAAFDASNMSHGKRELQAEPHNIVFIDGSYKITPDCLAQLDKATSPIGNLNNNKDARKGKKTR